MNISKGTIIFVASCWYVVVEVHEGKLFCICDNANNIYSWNLADCDCIASAKEAISAANWGNGDDKLISALNERECPFEVIAEVLVGLHDDRFDHWK